MKKLILLVCIISFCKPTTAQSNFLGFDAQVNNGGGIAAYCLSHNTTYLQNVYVNGGFCTNGNTYAYYNIASREVITANNNHYGARLNSSSGFPNFAAALANNGFDITQVKIKFSAASLGSDTYGSDWFSAGRVETRFYRGGTYIMQLNGSNLVSGNMPDFQLKINYNNGGNCFDDMMNARSNFAVVADASNASPANVQAVAAALLADIGNRGLAFDFATISPAIVNQFLTNQCNAPFNVGAYFECTNGKILMSDYPVFSINNNIPLANACTSANGTGNSTNSGNWMHISDNGSPIASILDNSNMGLVAASYYTTPNVRGNAAGVEYAGRNITLAATNQPSGSTRIRFYFTQAEWNAFIAANDADGNDPNVLSDMVVTRVCAASCNNAVPVNGYGELLNVIESGAFNNGYYIDVKTNSLGTFYFHSGNAALLQAPPAPTGNFINCSIGSTAILSATDFNTVWSSSANGVATVSSAGLASNKTRAMAVANGITEIAYNIIGVNNCKMPSPSVIYRVAAIGNMPAIAGPNNVCVGSAIQLQNAMPNGSWSSLNNAANINAASGLLTGANGGVANIQYTVSNAFGCSSFVSTAPAVNVRPAVPGIGYAAGSPNPQNGAGGGNNFCNNRVFNLAGNPAGGVFSSSNNAVFTVDNAGQVNTVGLGNATLTYTVSNANGCTSSRSIAGTVVGCAARGVNVSEELRVKSYELYPNPAKTFISLNVHTLMGVGNVVVTDLYGKQLAQQPLSIGTNTIDVSRLAKGMYFVSVITEQGKETRKVVVE